MSQLKVTFLGTSQSRKAGFRNAVVPETVNSTGSFNPRAGTTV
jgi:hypothetical protein